MKIIYMVLQSSIHWNVGFHPLIGYNVSDPLFVIVINASSENRIKRRINSSKSKMHFTFTYYSQDTRYNHFTISNKLKIHQSKFIITFFFT